MLLAGGLAPATSRAEDFFFSERQKIQGCRLSKATEGELRWLFFTVCEGALYTVDGVMLSWPELEDPFMLELAYHREISVEKLQELSRRVFNENTTKIERRRLQDQLAQFHTSLQPVQPGDRYALLYQPAHGTTLLHNGQIYITIPGRDFARHYFSIYLGTHPINEDFRDALLDR
ncbi:MAG: hypothetical protein E1N59_143 [Puniceicoccaceae bacterium 5H]|nr:MAG: hypothetical protein E1N59_143 [Puniceicoccaceae bacterium 5H]